MHFALAQVDKLCVCSLEKYWKKINIIYQRDCQSFVRRYMLRKLATLAQAAY